MADLVLYIGENHGNSADLRRLRERHSLGDARQGTGLPLWNDLLAPLARLAGGRHLTVAPFCNPGLARSERKG